MLLLLPLRRAFAIFRTVFARSLGSRHARLFETAPDTIASTSSPGAQVCAFVNLGSLQLREAAAPESSQKIATRVGKASQEKLEAARQLMAYVGRSCWK